MAAPARAEYLGLVNSFNVIEIARAEDSAAKDLDVTVALLLLFRTATDL